MVSEGLHTGMLRLCLHIPKRLPAQYETFSLRVQGGLMLSRGESVAPHNILAPVLGNRLAGDSPPSFL